MFIFCSRSLSPRVKRVMMIKDDRSADPRYGKDVTVLSNGNILIVEDEEKLARVISLELEYDGYSVKAVHDGTVGLAEAESSAYDLILLDIMLPGMSGLELLRRLRRRDPYTPVILLTARDEVPDKVSGFFLDLGANDYVTNRFRSRSFWPA